MNQKGFAPILIIVGILIITSVAGGAYYLGKNNPSLRGVSPKADDAAILPTPSTSPSSTDETTNWKTYKNKYFSVLYPNTWYIWSFGRGVDLDYWQINSVPADQQSSPNAAYISFDIQGMTFTDYSTLEEYRNFLQKMKKEMPQYNLVISDTVVNGQQATISEKTIDNNPAYEKIVWLVRGGKKYIVTWTIHAQTIQERDSLKDQYKADFDQILSTFRFLP